MMEYWNNAILGSGKTEECVICRMPSDLKIKKGIKPFKNQLSSIPPFHYSMVEAKI